MKLRDRIRELLDAGEVNPHVIARRLTHKSELKWLLQALMEKSPTGPSVLEGVIADLARDVIRNSRSGVEQPQRITRTQKYGLDLTEMLAAPVYVPGNAEGVDDWKSHAELSADECRRVAQGYRDRAARNEWWAERYETWAGQMESAGARRLAELVTVAA